MDLKDFSKNSNSTKLNKLLELHGYALVKIDETGDITDDRPFM